MAVVEVLGGALAAIEKGYYRTAITDGAIRRQREFDTGNKAVVGVNKFRTESQDQPAAFRIDPRVEATQVKRLYSVKEERRENAVKEALAHVRETAGTDENLVPAVLEAVRAYATVGEICDVFRQEFGEYQQREYFSPKN